MSRIWIAAAFALASCGGPTHSDNRRAVPLDNMAAVADDTPIVNVVTQAQLEKEGTRETAIDEARRKDPKVNWMHIGISTGKFSESLSVSVYKTYDECEKAAYSEDNECAPIAALPASYWDAQAPTTPGTEG